jgi:hypothetical protein
VSSAGTIAPLKNEEISVSIWASIWDLLGTLFWAFVFVSALIAVWAVISDLMRDRAMSGWAKAIWIVALVFLPLLTSLVYFIARGSGMADRASKDAVASQKATDDYIRSVAAPSPADSIVRAKELIDGGTITQDEFETLKRHALAGSNA